MDARAKELVEFGSTLFSKKSGFSSMCQEIAEQFYPERADFLEALDWGQDFASHLSDSFPVLARRELCNTLSSMLRPKDRNWFKMTTLRDELDEDQNVAAWMEHHSAVIRRAIYDPKAKFVRATKEGDHDYGTFGQCVISVEEDPERTHLYFRCWHLRDCAWLENDMGEIDHLHRNMKMQARNMKRRWGDSKLHPSIKKACEKEGDKEFPVRHIVLPAEEYDYSDSEKPKRRQLPFVSIYIDVDNSKVISEAGLPEFRYIVPRWATISGFQYAFSPATLIALPDARLAQEMARVLLEAGEKAVDPAIIATQEAVRSDVNLQSGGITWVDSAYDERLGEALRPLHIEGDFRTGMALRLDVREMLNKSMFLDKLALPEAGHDMTAFEVGRRLEEFVRNALPLFEPMEVEYNSRLLDAAFGILRNTPAFDWESMPDELAGRDIHFAFENPLQQAEGRARVTQFQEVLGLIASTMQVNPQATIPVDLEIALKDAVRGTSSPSDWMLDEEVLEQNKEQTEELMSQAADATQIATGAQVAGASADSLLKLREAGIA